MQNSLIIAVHILFIYLFQHSLIIAVHILFIYLFQYGLIIAVHILYIYLFQYGLISAVLLIAEIIVVILMYGVPSTVSMISYNNHLHLRIECILLKLHWGMKTLTEVHFQ